jgi:hypothetical protein
MSMSEFERQLNSQEDDQVSFSARGRVLPTDFSEEEIAFAQELDSFFAFEEEQTPPYFAQTLLEPDNPRFRVVEHGFEHRIRARVFRHLHLHHHLSHPRSSFLTAMRNSAVRGSMGALIAACLLFMLFTMAFTHQSFVEGVTLLLHGVRSGVYQVHNYPDGVAAPPYRKNYALGRKDAHLISLSAAQQLLHFPMYWPQVTPNSYELDDINLYQQPAQTWADGPILELQYDYISPGATHNTSEIAIREFKPNAAVLQVVEAGAAQTLQVDAQGHTEMIYVNGQWVSLNKFSHRWVYGGRSELIYQRDGVVFWIVSDQRDGVGKDILLQIAQSLQMINLNHMLRVSLELSNVTQLVSDSSELFAGDIIAVLPDDNLASPYVTLVGPDQPPLQEKTVQKHATHSH